MPGDRLLRAYLIVGTDEVKRDAAIRRLKARLDASGFADFNLDERDMTRFDGDIEGLLSSLNTLPMGSDFRLVILRGCDRLQEPVRLAIVDYLDNPSESTVLLIIADSLAKNTKLYKAVVNASKDSPVNPVIDCKVMKAYLLPETVCKFAAGYGKRMRTDAARELVSRAGDGTRMLENEVRKLAAMVEGDEITLSDVERHVVRTAEVKPWDFLNAVSARDLPRALEQYRIQPPKSEVRLHGLLCKRLRELICAQSLDRRGRAGELACVLGLQDWQVENHVRWARRFGPGELEGALRSAVDVECALKGSRDSVNAFVTWVASIAGR